MGKHDKTRPKKPNPIFKVIKKDSKKTKTKPVKTGLKKLNLNNRKAIENLDKKLGAFQQALQKKPDVEVEESKSVKEPMKEQHSPVSIEETMDRLEKL